MSYALAILAGILVGVPLSGFLFGRWVDEETFRRYLRRIAARRGWDWLLESCSAGEALAQAALSRQQIETLGRSIERVRDLTYSDRLAFGPAHFGAGEQYIRIDIAKDDDGLLHPVAVVSGQGPWRFIPLEEATQDAVLEAMGPAQPLPLAWLLARVPDSQLLALPGAQRTSLVHALLRDEELPRVVEGLEKRYTNGRIEAQLRAKEKVS